LCTVTIAEARIIERYGFFGGVSSSAHAFADDNLLGDDQRRRVGFHAGAYAQWLSVSPFSLVSQLSYSEKGTGLEYTRTSPENPTAGPRVTDYTRLSYVSFCALGRLTIAAGTFAPYLQAGPRLDYLVDYEKNLLFTSVYEEFKTTLLGVTIGGGVEGQVQPGLVLFIDFRYHIDLADSYEARNDLFHYTWRNTSFEISGGAGF
jgi:hypothetical protein